MPLKAILENLDDLDPSLHDHYTEKDGKYILQVELFDKHPQVVSLKAAFERLKEDRRKFLADLKAKDYEAVIAKLGPLPEDFDLEEYNGMRERITELEEENETLKSGNDDPKKTKDRQDELTRLRERLEQKNTTLQRKYDEMVATKDKEINDIKSTLKKTIIEDSLNSVLDEVKVAPKLKKAAKALLRDDIAVEEVDGVYKPVVKTDLGEVTLGEYVKTWAASDDGKEFVDKMKGSGAEPSDKENNREANPWVSDPAKGIRPNLTKQGEILKTDKAKAKRLMEAAKIDPARIARTLGQQAA
jgi:hypothetical protein